MYLPWACFPLPSFSKGSFVLRSSLAKEKRNFNAAQGVYLLSMIVIWTLAAHEWRSWATIVHTNPYHCVDHRPYRNTRS